MTAHACADCGMLHDTPTAPGPDREVEIARINAERDKYVARVNARQVRDELETDEAIAEIETEATVAAAAVEAEIIGAALDTDAPPAPEPDPIVIDAPVIDDEPDDEPPPADDDHQPHAPRKARGLGMW